MFTKCLSDSKLECLCGCEQQAIYYCIEKPDLKRKTNAKRQNCKTQKKKKKVHKNVGEWNIQKQKNADKNSLNK